MANLTYELGFDGNANAIEGVRDGIYPLQVYLVADEERKVISACNPDQIRRSDRLSFRIYDFSDPAAKRPHGMTPVTLQILFTRATKSDDGEVKPPFSPIVENGLPLAQLATTTFTPLPEPTGSIAFGKAALAGWEVEFPNVDLLLQHTGRFDFRALLTVGIPGEVARFFRVDPEMVIGDDDGGP